MIPREITRQWEVFELEMLEQVVTVRHLPRRLSYIVFFILTASTLDWQIALRIAALIWFVLFLILRPSVCLRLSGTNFAAWSSMTYFGLRWIAALICAGIIWVRTSSAGWDGWWPLAGVVLLDAFATIAFDAQELGYVRHQIATITAEQAREEAQ